MKKFLCAFVLVMIMCATVMAADKVDTGILTYLGTTEAEFQQALDDLRKALTPLLTEESAKQEWEDYDLLEGFLSELVRARRVVHFYDSLVAMQMALKACSDVPYGQQPAGLRDTVFAEHAAVNNIIRLQGRKYSPQE